MRLELCRDYFPGVDPDSMTESQLALLERYQALQLLEAEEFQASKQSMR